MSAALLLRAAVIWTVCAAALLLPSAAVLTMRPSTVQTLSYVSAGISFLAAFAAGITAGKGRRSRAFSCALLTALVLIAALLTAGFLIRGEAPEAIQGIEWISFGSTAFDAMLPVYANVEKMPAYLSDVTLDTSTENFYWGSRLIGALVDPIYAAGIQQIERYQNAVAVKGRQIVREYDRKIAETGDEALIAEANEKLAAMAKERTTDTLNKILLEASKHMKNGYNLADN